DLHQQGKNTRKKRLMDRNTSTSVLVEIRIKAAKTNDNIFWDVLVTSIFMMLEVYNTKVKSIE
ncbi:4452_t:CDS:1, partial [Dentiscutata heterogama]